MKDEEEDAEPTLLPQYTNYLGVTANETVAPPPSGRLGDGWGEPGRLDGSGRCLEQWLVQEKDEGEDTKPPLLATKYIYIHTYTNYLGVTGK